jgi:hypothetical protein
MYHLETVSLLHTIPERGVARLVLSMYSEPVITDR